MEAERVRFDWLQGDLKAREGSTTLIATVFSSASVILLGGFILTLDDSAFPVVVAWVVGALGFVFPILGEIYRELTILTVDAADLADLHELLARNNINQSLRRNATFVTRFKRYRRGSIRVLLLLPSVAWVGVALRDVIPGFVLILIILVLLLIVRWLNAEEHVRKLEAKSVTPEQDENQRETQPQMRRALAILVIVGTPWVVLALVGGLVISYGMKIVSNSWSISGGSSSWL